jgi:hypothetical protein
MGEYGENHRVGDLRCRCVSCRVANRASEEVARRTFGWTFLWVSIVWTLALTLMCING